MKISENEKDILLRLEKVFKNTLGRQELTLEIDTKLSELGEINSFQIMALISAVEDEFDIEISNSKIKSLKSVKNIIKEIA